jgi:hypothetical protein
MHTHSLDATQESADSYLFGRRQAWFAFAMTIALMVFDYVDRQVIVSLFPHMKQEWGLSDKQLGGLVSVVSITIALAALPVALFADRAAASRASSWPRVEPGHHLLHVHAQPGFAGGALPVGEPGAAQSALPHRGPPVRGCLMAASSRPPRSARCSAGRHHCASGAGRPLSAWWASPAVLALLYLGCATPTVGRPGWIKPPRPSA